MEGRKVVEIVEGLRRSDIMVVLSGCLCGLKDTLSDSDTGMCYYCVKGLCDLEPDRPSE